MAANDLDLDFDDPKVFLDDPYPLYMRLQREAPAYWYQPRRIWILSTYADVKAVSSNPAAFRSAHGLFWVDTSPGRTTSAGSILGPDLIFLNDAPRHGELRRTIAPAFAPRAVARLQPQVAAAAEGLLDSLDMTGPIDWVSTFAKRFPTLLVLEILGLPREDEEKLRSFADALEASIGYEDGQPGADFDDVRAYLSDVFETKFREPDNRLISTLVKLGPEANIDRPTLINLVITVIAGGNHTSRAMLSGFAAAMAENPDQFALLHDRPELVPNAIEETLRWVTPTRGHIRTAAESTELPSGQTVAAGERVYLAYHAANRDAAVFDRPNEFDVTRESSKLQLAFGYGAHTCIAAPLIRMASAVFVPLFLAKVKSIELAGPEVRVDTMLRSGWDTLTVRLVPAD